MSFEHRTIYKNKSEYTLEVIDVKGVKSVFQYNHCADATDMAKCFREDADASQYVSIIVRDSRGREYKS